MKKRIASIEEFNKERRRTRLRIEDLETLIEQDVRQLKETLQPVRVAGDVLKNFLAPEKDSFVSNTIGLTIDALISRLFFRKSKSLFKSIVVFLLSNVARNLVSKNSENIIEWLKKILATIKSDQEGEKEEAGA